MAELPLSVGSDTSCFIYLFEHPGSERARLISQLVDGRHRIIASTLALGEFLVRPHRDGTPAEVAEVRATFEALPGLELIPVSADIADEAARIRAATNLRLPDSIHIATAIFAGAEALLTNDRQLLRAAMQLPILVIDELVSEIKDQ